MTRTAANRRSKLKSLWNKRDARACNTELELRAYSSRLLGREPALVLHGGGNTSCKGEVADIFGVKRRVLYVKGSGWDLKSIGAAGFAPTDLDYLLRLAELEKLHDTEMMRQLRLATLDPAAPNPSVEAILHALIPHRYVDHTHADAVATLSNSPNGGRILRELYGAEALVLPYIMPGFALARQVAAAARGVDWNKLRGIVLLQHGIFSFHEHAEGSYETMIELVDRAEQELSRRAAARPSVAAVSHPVAAPVSVASVPDPGADLSRQLCGLRQAAGQVLGRATARSARRDVLTGRNQSSRGTPMLLRLDTSTEAAAFARREDCGALIQRGPLTPDHTLHAKPFGAVFDQDPLPGLRDFERDYLHYFEAHAGDHHQCLDAAPRYGVWRDRGMVYLAPNSKRLEIVADISAHTIRATQLAEAIGGWRALPREKLFEVEYWELEQAKLAGARSAPELQGKIALVTGAASGIGRAATAELRRRGAVVAALDIDKIEEPAAPDMLPLRYDVTDSAAVGEALDRTVSHFGGLDILVSNAGSFPGSADLADLSDDAWERCLSLNLSSHMKVLRACLPLLEYGFDPAVVFVASKNVAAPGPGAGAYSAAKAGLTQLARVAALEAAPLGIRVNVVHPNAVYDTGVWTDQALRERAQRYGMEVEQYKTSSLLGIAVRGEDVAVAIVSLAGTDFSRTTGAQIPVDAGHERVI